MLWGAFLYSPVVRLPLLGDDYHWWQLGRAAFARPGLVLEPLGQFWRPLATASWALETRVWNRWAGGYHLTNLVLVLVCAGLLILVARRFGLSRWPAVAIGLLWVGSPFAEEPAVSVSARHDSQLFLAWLVVLLVWPKAGKGWSRWRGFVVIVAGIVALLAKETWVATPILVAALEWMRGIRGRSLARSLAPWVLAVILYSVLHAMALPSGGYLGDPVLGVVKILHEMAAFLWLELLVPLGFQWSVRGVLAAFVVLAAAVSGWRRNAPPAVIGTALLLAGLLPTALVPYLPSRYTLVPYAGFLLLAFDTAGALGRAIPARWRTVAVWLAWATAVLVAAGGAFAVRADLVDWGRVGAVHRRLLREAAAVKDWPAARPVAVVRGEREDPLAEIAETPRGLAKIYFPRGNAPYALIAPAPLFEWTLGSENMGFRQVRGAAGAAGAILVHRNGGFVWLARNAAPLDDAVRRLQEDGARVVVIRRMPIGTWP